MFVEQRLFNEREIKAELTEHLELGFEGGQRANMARSPCNNLTILAALSIF